MMARSEELQALLASSEKREAASPEMIQSLAVIRGAVAISGAIRQRRIDRGWNQQQLADAMGTTQPVVARLENPSEERMPNLSTVLKATAALDLKLDLIDECSTEQAAVELVGHQFGGTLQHYRAGHPYVQGAVVVVRAAIDRIVLPQGIAIERDVDAPMIDVQLDD